MKSTTYEATRRAWTRIWAQEADFDGEVATLGYARARQTKALYLPYLPRDELILEAGCGLGIEVLDLAGRGYRVVGLDYVEGAVRATAARGCPRPLTTGDVHELPYRSGVFGACLSFGVLEHFEHGPEAALREANRVLRTGGILVVTVPYPSVVWRLVRLKHRLTGIERGECYETTYGIGRLVRHLHGAGFDVVRRHPVGHSFVWWGLGRCFRGSGYYETSPLAEALGRVCARLWPWPTCFASLVIARKVAPAGHARPPAASPGGLPR
jgi:SAM-dependent methyltransferase